MTPHAHPRSPPPHPPLLLLVEDQPEDLRWLIPLLQPSYRVSVAATGQQGFQRAQALQPQLLLLDVLLPDMDGYALCRLLKTDPLTHHIPVLFLSAHNEPAQRLQGLVLGAVDFISKPYYPEEVLARIQIHLRLAALGQEHQGQDEPGQAAHAPRDPGAVLAHAAAAFIREHLGDALDVQRIARQVGVHERPLLALFHQHFGCTVSRFLSDERVRAGQRLLALTDIPVQEIAGLVGYGNPGNFSTAFRERHGLTPVAYRQAMRKQHDARDPP